MIAISRPGAISAAAALSVVASLAVLAPASAATPLPLQVDSSSVQLVDGVVAVAPGDSVSVTFTNVSAGEVDPDEISLPFDATQLVAGAPIGDALTSIGVDPATVVHETTSIQVDSDGCSFAALAAGDSCTVALTLLPQGLGTQRPFGAGIHLVDATTGDTVGDTFVIWPPAPDPRPSNDDFANATDLSAMAIPAYGSPELTIAGDTTAATIEPGEFGTTPANTSGPTASVWYRYTSPPGGFAGWLGYGSDPDVQVTPVVAGIVDPLNPGVMVPTEPPTTVDSLAWSPGNALIPEVPGLRGYVRMEPGHTVWFQVWAASWAAPGPFTLRLVQAPDQQDDVALAYDVWQGNPFGDNTGWVGDGGTFHTTADVPGGLPTTWSTHVFDSSGQLTVRISSQTALTTPSTEPLGVAVYRAPSGALVTDASTLGAPVASTAGALGQSWAVVGGSWQLVDGWVAELTDVAVEPGRYYIGVTRPSGAGTFFQINDTFHAASPPPPPPTDTTPPTVTITGAPPGVTTDSGATLTATADEQVATMACTLTVTTPTGDPDTVPIDCATVVGGTTVTVPLTGLPDGEVTVTVTATDLAGNVGSASATWDVEQPPTVTITAPGDGDSFAAADVPQLDYACADNGTIAGVADILVDGQPGSVTLPTAEGAHTVEVRCTDTRSNVGSATVGYTVVATFAVNDVSFQVPEDTPAALDLFVYGVHAPLGSAPTLAAITPPQHGTATIAGDAVNYLPDPDYNGTDQFTYTVTLPDGRSGTATVTLDVLPVNDAPVAVADALAVAAGATAQVDVLANDTDVDGDDLHVVQVARVAGSPTLGTLTCPATGACTYQAVAPAGGVERWAYTVADPSGATAVGVLTVTVSALPPAAADQLSLSISGGVTLSASGPVTSGNFSTVPPGTRGGGRIFGTGTVGTTTVSFTLYRPRNSAWFGTIRVIDASAGVDLIMPVYGAVVRIAPDGTYSATITGYVLTRTAPWIRPVTLRFSVRDLA